MSGRAKLVEIYHKRLTTVMATKCLLTILNEGDECKKRAFMKGFDFSVMYYVNLLHEIQFTYSDIFSYNVTECEKGPGV